MKILLSGALRGLLVQEYRVPFPLVKFPQQGKARSRSVADVSKTPHLYLVPLWYRVSHFLELANAVSLAIQYVGTSRQDALFSFVAEIYLPASASKHRL